jgi:hypothetical protein
MISGDFELVRQLQSERQCEAAAHRMVRSLHRAEHSGRSQWQSFPSARHLVARIRDFIGVGANRTMSQLHSLMRSDAASKDFRIALLERTGTTRVQ